MTTSDKIKALQIIEAKQQKCAPVVVQIGYVIGTTVYHDGLVLKEACPAVIDALIENNFDLDMREDGLHVQHY